MHALNPHILTILHSFFSIQTYTDRISLSVFNEIKGERPYACDICNKTFAVKSYVTAHR